jgi:esterase/lipase
MDMLCWNYRGYGFSKGTPSYSKLRSDVLELFDEVKKNNNYERYAVHGISIGGIPCCHLASHRKEIELLICDRNFGRIDNIVQSFPYGKLLFKLYKLLLFQSTDNVENYLNVKCYKIIMNDPKDTIVLDSCSLKTLISMK